ncbi:MAG: hypothetical protein KA523_04965 [Flavobacterium sp.]|nr:hypothetical protein [Flavobacterium sp.]
MRKINFKYIVAVAALGFFTSCEPDNDTTNARGVKPVVTAAVTSFTIAEGQTATVNLTVDTPYFRTMDFKLELVGGTGSYKDYTSSGTETDVNDGWGVIGHKISVPAYAATASFDITPLVDYLPEGAETLIFRLYPMGNSNGLVAATSETITVNVSNTVLTDVKTELKWATTYNAHGNLDDILYAGVDGTSHSLEAYDFDILIFGPQNIFTGATGAEPEYATIASTRPNGDFEIWIDLYDTPRRLAGGTALGTGYKPTSLLLLKPVLTVSKPGVWVKEIDLSYIWNSNTVPSVVPGNDPSYYAGKVTKAGTTYTLFDEADVQLATGRAAGKVMPRVERIK